MQPNKSGSPSRQDLMPSRNLAMRPGEGSRQLSKQSIGLVASRNGGGDIEQEFEGGQAAAAAMQAPDIDTDVRTEVSLGIQQIRTIEQQLRISPQGLLGRVDGSEAQALRMTLMNSSAIVMGCFSKIMSWLSNPNSVRNDNFSATDRIGRADSSTLSTSYTYDSDPANSPRNHFKQQVINSTSPVVSPCHTPRSVSGMSEDSPTPASPLVLSDADGDAAAVAATTVTGAGRAHRPGSEATTSADPDATKPKMSVKRSSVALSLTHAGISSKSLDFRKFMPKFNCQQRASDSAHEGPPYDRHTWRKYGQKDILGSKNPRSYYRCTHKNELGCPAIKYVQRCDDDSMVFDVTYRGTHTCQSVHQQHPAWHIACFPEQMAIANGYRVHQLPTSDTTSSPAIANYPSLDGNHVNSLTTQSQVTSSDEILLGVNSNGFSQLASGLPMVGGVPSTVGILDMSTFSLNPVPSMGMGTHHHAFPVKPEDHNASQPQVFDVSRLDRDGTFGSDLFNILLARPGQIEIPFPSAEEGLQSETKRFKAQHELMELARSADDESGQVDQSAGSEYGARWVPELDADYRVPIEGQTSQRYNSNSSIVLDSSGSGQSRPLLPNNQTTSAERGRIASMKESDNSVETSGCSLPIGPGITVDDMDYETFLPSCQTYFC